MVPGDVKRQDDIAIDSILSRSQKRQVNFAILSAAHYSNNDCDAHHDDAYDNDITENDGGGNDDEGEDDEGAFRAVHYQGLLPELLRETLNPMR